MEEHREASAKILLKQERMEPWKEYLLRLGIVTFVYFKLSIFQRHHARVKIRQIAGQDAKGCRNAVSKAA